MNIGDIITDTFGTKWIIFDFHNEYLCVTDFNSQKINGIMDSKSVIKVENYGVEWLFLARRMKNLKGLELYL